jgi:putative Mg2+ transporter-C (MgtC) family protein
MNSMATIVDENVVKLAASLAAGAIIGAEREYRSKNAGFRTIILITLGSTLFTIISLIIAGPHDPARVASNIITGIGFLGAGAIFKEGVTVKGLTTAAVIWVSAAIGMSIGIGEYQFAGVVLFFVMIIMVGFPYLQQIIDNYNSERLYKVTVYCNVLNMEELHRIFHACHLKSRCLAQHKKHEVVTLTFAISGADRGHVELIKLLHESSHIIEFEA